MKIVKVIKFACCRNKVSMHVNSSLAGMHQTNVRREAADSSVTGTGESASPSTLSYLMTQGGCPCIGSLTLQASQAS